MLLRAYDDDISRLAMTVLASLAVPPNYHKCVDTNRHTTALHKTPLMCSVLFEVIESLNFMVSAEKMMTEDFEVNADMKDASIIANQANKLYYTDENNNEIGLDLQPVVFADDDEGMDADVSLNHNENDTKASDKESKANILFFVSDVCSDSRSLADIVNSIDSNRISWKQKLNFMWQVRGKRWLKSLRGRGLLLSALHEASLVLLCCHSDASLLSKFFQDKSEFLKDYIFLLKTGPTSTESAHRNVPSKLRTLSTQCLTAMIASRESGSSSVLSGICRFSLLQQDLGINRSQYMGLLPCIIRSSLVSVVEDEMQGQSSEVSRLNAELWEFNVTSEYEEKVLWCECVLIFVISLINMTSSALPTLTETGFIQTMLQVLGAAPSLRHSKQRVYLNSLILQVIDSSIGNNGQTLNVFKEAKGAEVLIDALSSELNLYFSDDKNVSSDVSVPYCNQIVLQQLLTVLSSFFNDERAENGGNDPRQTQIVKGLNLEKVLVKILDNSFECQSLVIAPAIGLITDLINGDTAPPGVLNHYLANGLAEKALKVVELSTQSSTEVKQKVVFDSLLLQSVVNIISALGITSDGIKLIIDVNPFPFIFRIFSDVEYYKPPNNIFRNDLSSILGGGFEEILRHNPQLLTSCLSALLNEINNVVTKSENVLVLSTITSSSSTEVMDVEGSSNCSTDPVSQFVPYFHFATTATSCLEALLLRKQSVSEFLNIFGFEILLKLHRLALGPSRYLLASLQCAVSPSNFTIGHQPLVQSIVRCASHVWDAEPSKFLNSLLGHLRESKNSLLGSLNAFYRNRSSGHIDVDKFDGCLPHFLDMVSNKTVYDCYDSENSAQLSADIEHTADVFRCFARVDFLVNSVALVFKMTAPGATANSANMKVCFDVFKSSESIEIFKSVVDDLYVSSQSEMARYKEVVSSTESISSSKHVYRLLITGRDSIHVKDGPDESSKRVCRYDKGFVVLAYDRVLGNNNVVKYRTEDGWISHLKSATSTDAQVEVIDVIRNTRTLEANEDDVKNPLNSSIVHTLKNYNNEKLKSISVARGGLISFFHYHLSIRNFLVGLSKTLYYVDSARESSGSNSLVFGDHSHLYIDLITNCFHKLLPQLPSYDQLVSAADSTSGILEL